MNNQASRVLPSCLLSGILFLALVLTGCGVSSTTVGAGSPPSTASSTSSPATGQPTPTAATPAGSFPSSTLELTCVLQVAVRPIDSIGETLHCTVSHMPSSQMRFVLHYSIQNNAGKSIVVPPVCQGTLSGGAGSCTAIFSSPLPQLITRGVVSGSTQPNQYPLGPIIPKQVSGTTPIGTPLPFQPHG